MVYRAGTFRPDRIRAIAERFGVNGDTALENILYGGHAVSDATRVLIGRIPARAYNSEHQVGLAVPWAQASCLTLLQSSN